jgi:hypothetical protein
MFGKCKAPAQKRIFIPVVLHKTVINTCFYNQSFIILSPFFYYRSFVLSKAFEKVEFSYH